ncbi:hypothetical protein VA7868_02204 [Vibrio aerogenes CECT 7868]|uniref:Uncharacterized protein n=1 Tax=Vibrio aerogenes CECT 7868 TaxID=1216006 RepID=A0A1M5Z2A5_9VIBR|nr:hypothetical protein [Vibrio aerogenes]SHI18311.1 hypothetical protein VA7868_02204 [Vibrio aerogenes CECT 7868]
MKDVFYFSKQPIELLSIKQNLQDYYNDILLNEDQDALQIKINKEEMIQIVSLNVTTEFGDPEDCDVIEATGVKSCICISHHSFSIDCVKDILKIILKNYGGWVGNDSDYFEPRFVLDDIDSFRYSD